EEHRDLDRPALRILRLLRPRRACREQQENRGQGHISADQFRFYCSTSASVTRRPSRADLMPARITASDAVLFSPSISGSPSPRTARLNSSSSSTIGSFSAHGTGLALVSPRRRTRRPL